jgi:hypothetical protein
VHVQLIPLTAPLSQEICAEDQRVCAEAGGVEEELNEEFEGRFADNAPNPWAEVVHFVDAAVHLAAVVCTVGFPVETCGAERRPAIKFGDKMVLEPKFRGWGSTVVICMNGS